MAENASGKSTTDVPVVGKSFYTFCKKCDTDRYQTVLAMPTPTSAKIKCEVCGSSKTWKAPKAGATGAPRGAAATAKAKSVAAKASAHNAEYETLSKEMSDAPEVPYSMKNKFDKKSRLKHPTFGTGYIRAVQAEKIEVVFQDEVRSLVHNRR